MISRADDHSGGGHSGCRASVLFGVMVVMVLAALMCLATLNVSTSETKSANAARQRLAALFAAESGIERQIADLRDLQRKASLTAPFQGIDLLYGQTTYTAQSLTKDGQQVGQYTVEVQSVTPVDSLTRDLTIVSTGYVPAADAPNAQQRRVTAVVRCQLRRSEVFDYVYFINNWGWYYGDTIHAHGNVRANGQFDCGGYAPVIDGIPRYRKVVGTDLSGYIDDNHDGLTDGSDGGIYAGWDIVNTGNVQGMGGLEWTQDDADEGRCEQSQVGTPKNQHDFLEQIPMPNLTDLTIYEEIAKSKNSNITIGGIEMCDSVVGDHAGEPSNLYLRGTEAAPIVLNGPVVVRGNLIISGRVTGHGAVYCGRNVYVPEDLEYITPPAPLPTDSPSESELEGWLADNQSADALGLFAREHVVCGDYTNSSWQYYVNNWVNDQRNKSEEDAGLDGIPNTKEGRDGTLGTDDDDVLEDDDEWTVEHYTQEDADRGIIPPGFSVGDAIPETGEDIDGDGQYDPTTLMSEFNVDVSLDAANWAGNMPAGVSAYSAISTTDLTKLDGAFYTNHTIAALTLAWDDDLHMRGCVVSRNEAIVYGTKTIQLHYDLRLYGGGESFGFFLPKTWAPVRTLLWQSN